jgi:hypothetical protein
MGEGLLELVDKGHSLLTMRPDGRGGVEILLLGRDQLADFGVGSPVALVLADLAAMDRALAARGYTRGGTYGTRELCDVTGMRYSALASWLAHGLVYAGPAPGSGHEWSVGYLGLLSAALAAGLRRAGQAPGPVLRLLADFLAHPRVWEPEPRADPKPRKGGKVHA